MNDRTYYKSHLQALTSCPISPRTSPFLGINSKYLHYRMCFSFLFLLFKNKDAEKWCFFSLKHSCWLENHRASMHNLHNYKDVWYHKLAISFNRQIITPLHVFPREREKERKRKICDHNCFKHLSIKFVWFPSIDLNDLLIQELYKSMITYISAL